MAPWAWAAGLSVSALLGLLAVGTVRRSRHVPGLGALRAALPEEFQGPSAEASILRMSDNPVGSTDVADRLNKQMERNPAKVYSGGKGILIRMIFDGYQFDDDKKVVPATFWVDDIVSPSQMYPQGNPMHPTGQYTDDAFIWPVVAVAVGSSLGEFFPNVDKIQDDHWGYGVFYPSDSNSVDARCRYIEDGDFFDCPGGTIDNKGVFKVNASMKGAGAYPYGNPALSNTTGGGAGCHFTKQKNVIDQINTKPYTIYNLVADKHCQCNYWFAHVFPQDQAHASPEVANGWDAWVSDLATLGLKGKAGPSWQMDLASCWTNNVRDMINMQNRIYWQHRMWLDGTTPRFSDQAWDKPEDRRRYWGWNEIPVDRVLIGNPQTWDTVFINLPAFLCGPSGKDDNVDCLTNEQKGSIEKQLDQHVSQHVLRVGLSEIAKRPGSYILFVRQVLNELGQWRREFFCQNLALWTYKIVYNPPDKTNPTGKCYLEWN